MSQHHFAQRALFAAVFSISSLVSVAAHADGARPRAAAFAAVLAAKDPSHFGPHLPVADLPSSYRAPVPGSIAALSAARDPSHFGSHLSAADQPSAYTALVPGSIAALLAVKDPSRSGLHLPAADSASGDALLPSGALAVDGRGRSGIQGCDIAC